MSVSEHSTVYKNLSQKTTEQLNEMLLDDRASYEPHVIETIKKILFERGISPDDVTRLVNEHNYRSSSSGISWKMGIGIGVVMIRVILLLDRCNRQNAYQAQTPLLDPDTSRLVVEQPWSPTYEQRVYDQIHLVAGSRYTTLQKKHEFAGCIVRKLKDQLPEGLSSIPKDSLRLIMNQDYSECAKMVGPIQMDRSWTPAMENNIKERLKHTSAVQKLDI
ncbi:hypothetical protein HH214_20890 [Mucilaginibacter robiniae]|uniref:Uncharacterized protein n=1 Tax=Mucilaginibacter robiniae TaxID=2728022 RepID=A0A7L5ECK9_9SPHI|nr:hypothetical protein [Mucilaginibacter robiniae]QJD98156.1 hypothetical protein HH214_20890 [Mucilaginibacter robiniae]